MVGGRARPRRDLPDHDRPELQAQIFLDAFRCKDNVTPCSDPPPRALAGAMPVVLH